MAYPSLPVKKPLEVVDYRINWAKRLENDRIVSSNFLLSANATTTISANSFSNTTATVWLQGGVPATTTVIYNIITTEGGRTWETAVQVKVVQP
jgi:hypothetical protein